MSCTKAHRGTVGQCPYCERDAAIAQLGKAREVLGALANIPLEEFIKRTPDQPLMGWNNHILYVRDVLAAREIIKGE